MRKGTILIAGDTIYDLEEELLDVYVEKTFIERIKDYIISFFKLFF